MISFIEKLENLLFQYKTSLLTIIAILLSCAIAFGDGISHFFSAIMTLFAFILTQQCFNLRKDKRIIVPSSEDISCYLSVPLPELFNKIFHFIRSYKYILLKLFLCFSFWIYLFFRSGSIIFAFILLFYLWDKAHNIQKENFSLIGQIILNILWGPIVVSVGYYIQSYEYHYVLIFAGLGLGLLGAALAIVHHMREIIIHKMHYIETNIFPNYYRIYQILYHCFVVIAFLLPIFIFLLIYDHSYILFSSLGIIFAIPSVFLVYTSIDKRFLLMTNIYIFFLLIFYCFSFSLGWILS